MASDPQDAHLSASQASGAADADPETLSPLEQEVLDEYARLLGNLNNVRTHPAPFAPPIRHTLAS
jgi:DASH complex subunit DAD3